MDSLNNIFDEIELICHEHMWNLKIDESIIEWNKRNKSISIKNKKSKVYSWQRARCGFIINGKYCKHKIHISGIKKHQKIDIDEYDRNNFCFIHRKYYDSQHKINMINMEKIIIERLKKQKEFFLSDNNMKYIEYLQNIY